MTMIYQPTALCPAWCTEHQIDAVDGSVYHWSAPRGTEQVLNVGVAEHEEGLTELRIFIDCADFTVEQVRTMARELAEVVRLAEEG